MILKLRNALCVLFIFLFIVNINLFGQEASSSYILRQKYETKQQYKARVKEAKGSCKVTEKVEGYTVDVTYGTAYAQFMTLIWLKGEKYTDTKGVSRDLWDIEDKMETSVSFSSKLALAIAESKARAYARDDQLAPNLGSTFSKRIEGGEHFYDGSGALIDAELLEATGAFNEIFAAELTRNKIITKFYIEDERNKQATVKISICLNLKDFEETISKMTKAELDKRIEKIKNKTKDTTIKIINKLDEKTNDTLTIYPKIEKKDTTSFSSRGVYIFIDDSDSNSDECAQIFSNSIGNLLKSNGCKITTNKENAYWKIKIKADTTSMSFTQNKKDKDKVLVNCTVNLTNKNEDSYSIAPLAFKCTKEEAKASFTNCSLYQDGIKNVANELLINIKWPVGTWNFLYAKKIFYLNPDGSGTIQVNDEYSNSKLSWSVENYKLKITVTNYEEDIYNAQDLNSNQIKEFLRNCNKPYIDTYTFTFSNNGQTDLSGKMVYKDSNCYENNKNYSIIYELPIE